MRRETTPSLSMKEKATWQCKWRDTPIDLARPLPSYLSSSLSETLSCACFCNILIYLLACDSAIFGFMEALQQSLSCLNMQRSPPCSLRTVSFSSKPLVSAFQSYNGLGSCGFVAKVQQQIGVRGSGNRAVVTMKDSAAASYASALVEIGKANKVLESLNADVKKLGNYLEDPMLFKFLTIPVIDDGKKKEVLKDLAKQGSFQSYTMNLLLILVDKKRTELLKEFVKEFEAIYNEITDTQVAVVTSAMKLDTSQLTQIEKKIQSLTGAKNVTMKNVIDPSVIAGFIINYGKDRSRLIDMSVKGQLARIAQRIDVSDKVALI